MKRVLISSITGHYYCRELIDINNMGNESLAHIHSPPVTDSGKHVSQLSNLPEHQNLCELRRHYANIIKMRISSWGL